MRGLLLVVLLLPSLVSEALAADALVVFAVPNPGMVQAYYAPKVAAWRPAMQALVEECADEATTGAVQARLRAADDPMKAALDSGAMVVAVDLRGMGESSAKTTHNPKLIGEDWQDSFRAYLMGDSLLRGRVQDLVCVVAFVQQQVLPDQPVSLHAWDAATTPALHAAALQPTAHAEVVLHGGLRSWRDVFDAAPPPGTLGNVVQGGLLAYDLPELSAVVSAHTTLRWE